VGEPEGSGKTHFKLEFNRIRCVACAYPVACSVQEGHTRHKKMFIKQNLIKILIMRRVRRGMGRAIRPVPLHNKNTFSVSGQL